MRILAISFMSLLIGSLSAADAVTYTPGCMAKIYVIGRAPNPGSPDSPDNKQMWPIRALPDTPSETLHLSGGPDIETNPADSANKGFPNYLVRSELGILNGVHFYAVEFEGWVLAKVDGIYTISTQSDDPVEVFIEGKAMIRSDFTANPLSCSANELGTGQCSVKLAGGKWYHVSIIARQQWWGTAQSYNGGVNKTNCGAHLKVWLAMPGGEASIIPLCWPSKIANP